MKAVNEVVRASMLSGRGLAFACVSTDVVQTMQTRHHTWPVATAALGRTATIGLMMGRLLKNEERLTLRVEGDGPLGRILVDADADGHVRGFVDNPFVHLPANAFGKLDVGGAVGRGTLYVTRDSGLKDFYTGSSELQSGEIADDFTYYFATSEQVPSAVGAGVLVGTENQVLAAGGFLLQLLPDAHAEDVDLLEARLRGVPSVTDVLQRGASAADLLFLVAPDAVQTESVPVEFRCTCSRTRLENVLKSLGRGELVSMLEEDGQAEVVCHFCNEHYLFDADDLRRSLAELDES